jgi:hypothetical protein
LIRRLRQKQRIDRLPNDVRGRRSRLGRFVYIALLFGSSCG